MPRDRIQYELTPERQRSFDRLKNEMNVDGYPQVIDIMLREYIKILDQENITTIEYKNKYGDLIASTIRSWFFHR